MSDTLVGSIEILERLELALTTRWGLVFKAGSTVYMQAKGAVPAGTVRSRWRPQEPFEALGHWLLPDGSSSACWQRTVDSCWRAFFASAGSAAGKTLGLDDRRRLLRRHVLPCIEFRASRWCLNKGLLLECDRLHRCMLGMCVRMDRRPGEEIGEFCRRRAHFVAARIQPAERWSYHVSQRVRRWHQHLQHPQNAHLWPSILLGVQSEAWLAARRATLRSQSLIAGRTGTRASGGFVANRWEAGAMQAMELSWR